MPDSIPNPLHGLHEQAGAEFQPYAQLDIVSTFGEPQAEYASIRKGCALIDLPQRGVLQLTGRDRHAFLNNLITNHVWDKQTKIGLAAGAGVYAYYLSVKGRIIANMNVLEIPDADGRTLLEMDARMVEPVRAAFDKYLFVEQVKMRGRVGELHEIALIGPKAREVLDQITETKLPDLPPLGSAVARVFEQTDAIVFRDDVTASPGYCLLVDAPSARAVWMNLIARFGESRALRAAGWAAYNATRVEAARPLFDIDFGNSVDPEKSLLPAEVGPGEFARAVSVTKGCYLGQEIVARMHARQQVAKQLVGIRLDEDALPMAGAPLMDEQKNQVGVVTSSTMSPVLSNASIALGYVKRPHFAEGTVLLVPAEGAMRRATVVKTPFVE